MKKLLESAKNLDVYKQIVLMYAEFVDAHSTAAATIYKQILEVGLKLIPKDDRAIDILVNILISPREQGDIHTYQQGNGGITDAIQPLENKFFADLPVTVRPVFKKEDGSTETAGWCKKVGDKKEDVKVFTKVWDLLNFNGETGGYWCDAAGNEVKLISVE